jgi:hypothetical protein
MASGEGARGPTDAKARPLSALAIASDIEYVPLAVEYATWPGDLPVSAYLGYLLPRQAAAALEGDLYL